MTELIYGLRRMNNSWANSLLDILLSQVY